MEEQVVNVGLKLPEESKALLENLEQTISDAENALDGLEAAGLDTAVLRKSLQGAKDQRDALLKYFS